MTPFPHRVTSMSRPLLGALVVALLCARSLAAQDPTKAVRIGLTYDPRSKPGIVVLPVNGPGADSIRAILQRDFDNGGRITVVPYDGPPTGDANGEGLPNWKLLAAVGAIAAVQATPTANGLHVAIYDVVGKQTPLVRDYTAPAMGDARAWRARVHFIADDLEESVTGTRGISRTRVVFERDRQIWAVDSDGEEAIRVSELGNPLSAAWSPNGSMIAYGTYRPAQIVVHDLGSGTNRSVANGSGSFTTPTFTPDGASVLYAHGVDDGYDLYSVPVEGGTSRRLSVGRGSDNISPSMSPDGRRVAFMSARAGHPEIYTMDADGTNPDPLTPTDFGPAAYRAKPNWSPDNRNVVFQSRVSGKFQVMSIGLRDKRVRQLTSDGTNEDPSWAPDGQHVVFTSNRSGTLQLWVLDIETGRARQLTHGAPSRRGVWSPRLATNG
ncbi:MAG: hypothetical protein ABJE47_23220 [bacterium]